MNRIEKIQVGLIIFIVLLGMVPLVLMIKDAMDISRMESVSTEKLKVTEVIDKTELQEHEDGKYYSITLKTHEKSHLCFLEVDKETFDSFNIGDLVSYERVDNTDHFKLSHYKYN